MVLTDYRILSDRMYCQKLEKFFLIIKEEFLKYVGNNHKDCHRNLYKNCRSIRLLEIDLEMTN